MQAAMVCPMYRTRRSANGGYGLWPCAASSGPASRMLIGPMSASVKTRPVDSGGLVTWRTLACALWLRTNAISCVPGMLISAMNMPCPWRCLASSLRSKLAPIQLAARSRSVILPAATYTFERYCMREWRCQRNRQHSRLLRLYHAIFLSGLLTPPWWCSGGGSFPVSREVLDDLQASADHMVTHDVVGPLCVRADNGSYDFVMLMKGILCSARDKLKRSKRCEPLPETTRHRSNAWIVCAQINRLVKFIIHRCEICVAIRNSFLSMFVENVEALLLQRAHSDGT